MGLQAKVGCPNIAEEPVCLGGQVYLSFLIILEVACSALPVYSGNCRGLLRYTEGKNQCSAGQTTRQMTLFGGPLGKVHGVIGCENQLFLSIISLIFHFISSLRTSMGVSSLIHVYFLQKIYSIYWAHVSVDGQEDDFCLSCIILMNRNNTRIFFISQTDTGN